MATVLITANPHDPATRYGYLYLRAAADYLAQYGHKIVFLRSATLQNFRSALAEYDPRFVILNGHGGAKSVTGANNEVLLGVLSYDADLGKKIVRENPSWTSGRIVFLFTCNAGKELAPRLAEESALAVAAFKSDYIFVSEDSVASQNGREYPFFMAPMQLPIVLAEGGTFREAVQAVRDAFGHYIEKAEAKGDTVQAKYLYYDLENFVVYGQPQVRL